MFGVFSFRGVPLKVGGSRQRRSRAGLIPHCVVGNVKRFTKGAWFTEFDTAEAEVVTVTVMVEAETALVDVRVVRLMYVTTVVF